MSFIPSREPPKPAARCRYPIVLLHGLFGFVRRKFLFFDIAYFRGVVPYLESAGNCVRALEVHPWQTIDYRSKQIRDAIRDDPALQKGPIHLIGHSMGGLDARYVATALGLGDRIASITSIASPHRGSFLADLALLMPGVRRWFPAIPDLTRKSMSDFNDRFPDPPGILSLSVPASTSLWRCCPLMWPSWVLLRIEGGRNDGQVTWESARWGEVLETVEADHLQVIGMRCGIGGFRRENPLNLFGRITETLSRKGL